jgi:hypothetical protein
MHSEHQKDWRKSITFGMRQSYAKQGAEHMKKGGEHPGGDPHPGMRVQTRPSNIACRLLVPRVACRLSLMLPAG